MGKNGGAFFACLCRPRDPEEMGVLSSKVTVAPTPSPSMQSKRRDPVHFIDDLAVSPFTPEDSSWFRMDDTEPTVEEEEEDVSFEAAYRFWYSKGLLSFVPESIQEERRTKGAQNGWASFPSTPGNNDLGEPFATPTPKRKKKSCPKPHLLPPASPSENAMTSPNVSKKLDFTSYSTPEKRGRTVTPKAQPPTPTKKSAPASTRRVLAIPELESQSSERRDLKLRSNGQTRSNQLLPPPRSKQEDCESCGNRIVTRVRCVQCKQTVYCSMFCRGNDRYKHGSICSKRYCEPTTPTASPKTPKVEEKAVRQGPPSWKKRVLVDEDPQPEAHTLRRFWEDRSNLEHNDQ